MQNDGEHIAANSLTGILRCCVFFSCTLLYNTKMQTRCLESPTQQQHENITIPFAAAP